jgi:hypothetical protein
MVTPLGRDKNPIYPLIARQACEKTVHVTDSVLEQEVMVVVWNLDM